MFFWKVLMDIRFSAISTIINFMRLALVVVAGARFELTTFRL